MEKNTPIVSKQLKRMAATGEGKSAFDTSITRLQAQCYVLIRDFVYERDRHGNRYGWGLAEYSTPEAEFGEVFCNQVYQRSPRESYERILAHLHTLFPDASEQTLRKVLK